MKGFSENESSLFEGKSSRGSLTPEDKEKMNEILHYLSRLEKTTLSTNNKSRNFDQRWLDDVKRAGLYSQLLSTDYNKLIESQSGEPPDKMYDRKLDEYREKLETLDTLILKVNEYLHPCLRFVEITEESKAINLKDIKDQANRFFRFSGKNNMSEVLDGLIEKVNFFDNLDTKEKEELLNPSLYLSIFNDMIFIFQKKI